MESQRTVMRSEVGGEGEVGDERKKGRLRREAESKSRGGEQHEKCCEVG